MKAWKAFEDNKIDVLEEVNAKKETLKTEGALALLLKSEKIFVASGKKTLEYDPGTADSEELTKKVTGRTGNLRAPTLRIGSTYYVGFNEELYSNLVK